MARHHTPTGGRRRRNHRPASAQPNGTRTSRMDGAGRVAEMAMGRTDERACKGAVRKVSARARKLMRDIPCLDRLNAERAAVGLPVDWNRFLTPDGVPRDVALAYQPI